jgi:hypothetical protein
MNFKAVNILEHSDLLCGAELGHDPINVDQDDDGIPAVLTPAESSGWLVSRHKAEMRTVENSSLARLQRSATATPCTLPDAAINLSIIRSLERVAHERGSGSQSTSEQSFGNKYLADRRC